MAQKKLGSRAFTTRSEIDLECCKQMSAHNIQRENTIYLIFLFLATAFMVFQVFWPDAKRWPGLLAIVVAVAWFWKTRSAGTKLYMKLVNPRGVDYLVRDITINSAGISEKEKETGNVNTYKLSQVYNFTRTKQFLLLFLTTGTTMPLEIANLRGGSPGELERFLLKACPRLRGGTQTTGAGIFIACAVFTAIDLFAWIGLVALCILHQ